MGCDNLSLLVRWDAFSGAWPNIQMVWGRSWVALASEEQVLRGEKVHTLSVSGPRKGKVWEDSGPGACWWQ